MEKTYTINGLKIHHYLIKNLDGMKTVKTIEEFYTELYSTFFRQEIGMRLQEVMVLQDTNLWDVLR